MPSDIHEAANTTKEGWIAWFCPLKLYRHYSGCRIWSGLLYRNYIKLYVSFCAARPGFVAYLFVVQYTTAVLYRCFYIRFVLPLIPLFGDESGENLSYESLPADHPVTNYRARQVASCLRNNSPLSTPIKRISHQPKWSARFINRS